MENNKLSPFLTEIFSTLTWSVIIFERSRSVEEALKWQGTGSVGCTSNAALVLHDLARMPGLKYLLGSEINKRWKTSQDSQ